MWNRKQHRLSSILWRVVGMLAVVALGLTTRPTVAAPGYMVIARITAYTQTGYTYSGTWTTPGRTAGCDWSIPLGSRVVLPDGQMFTCEDRGANDGLQRIDIYDPCLCSYVYDDWEYVEVR